MARTIAQLPSQILLILYILQSFTFNSWKLIYYYYLYHKIEYPLRCLKNKIQWNTGIDGTSYCWSSEKVWKYILSYLKIAQTSISNISSLDLLLAAKKKRPNQTMGDWGLDKFRCLQILEFCRHSWRLLFAFWSSLCDQQIYFPNHFMRVSWTYPKWTYCKMEKLGVSAFLVSNRYDNYPTGHLRKI